MVSLQGHVDAHLHTPWLRRRPLIEAGGVPTVALVDADLWVRAGVFGQQPEIGAQHIQPDLLYSQLRTELVEGIAETQRFQPQERTVLEEAAVLLDEVIIPYA